MGVRNTCKLSLLSALLTYSANTVANNNSDWMSQIPNDRVMNQLIIPGTHNSGSYNITGLSKFSLSPDDPLPMWIDEISNILPISLVRIIVAGWSKTQPYSIAWQLNHGIRYLDFRVCLFQSDFYLCHALLSIKLSDALAQIHQFVVAHPSEIVLVDLNHIYNVNSRADETRLVRLLHDQLGNDLIPNSFRPANTIGVLRQSKRNVIILIDTTHSITDPALQKFAVTQLWHQSNIDSPWPNQSNLADLKGTLDAEMAAHDKIYATANNFFVLQSIETEHINQVIDGILDPLSYPNNIQAYEQPLNNTLGVWLMGYIVLYGQPPMNIVIQDWCDKASDLVSLAIQYDLQEVSYSKDNVSEKTQNKLNALRVWYRKRMS